LKDSEIKLSQLEIARFQTIRATASRLTPQLNARLTTEFKKMLVERVRNYRASGAAHPHRAAFTQDCAEVRRRSIDMAYRKGYRFRHQVLEVMQHD
jgi:hypothetical protein